MPYKPIFNFGIIFSCLNPKLAQVSHFTGGYTQDPPVKADIYSLGYPRKNTTQLWISAVIIIGRVLINPNLAQKHTRG